ncbi:UrcA family protein [Sphingomonas jaspsi]|uniref:UrcA family protein n=1 Tax=Sphingomonas jaspsi TaxID=392409 RepID=UPI000A0421FE|nr:UrcA family protein [Sphingomonas jaspsi]
MKIITALCVVSACVSGTGVAQAAGQSDEPVIVRAQPDEFLPTRRVSYADLNLASKAGEKTLFYRVSGAVRYVCTGHDSASIEMQRCRSFAWSGARPQMKLAIQRAQELAANGTTNIAPVAIMIAAR